MLVFPPHYFAIFEEWGTLLCICRGLQENNVLNVVAAFFYSGVLSKERSMCLPGNHFFLMLHHMLHRGLMLPFLSIFPFRTDLVFRKANESHKSCFSVEKARESAKNISSMYTGK